MTSMKEKNKRNRIVCWVEREKQEDFFFTYIYIYMYIKCDLFKEWNEFFGFRFLIIKNDQKSWSYKIFGSCIDEKKIEV